jgi:serine/threonine protein kinase
MEDVWMTDRVGQQLGHYRLLRLLGEGGFAEVYLGEHVDLGRRAAIKVLSAKLSSEEIERFREEARTIGRLTHPSIVDVKDFGVEQGVPYLVMHYAAQGTLRQRHPKGTRLAPATILPYVRQIASALQYAHDQQVIHRDVKPENMLVGEQGEILLSDFGIATITQNSRYQHTGDVVGTIAYMAPEQMHGKPRPASDQYALGIVIYEWLCGERPFVGSMNEVVAQHLSLPPPPLRERVPELSPEVEQVVLTALEKDPKARFASMQAFANAFEQASQTETPRAVLDQAVTLTELELPMTMPVTPARPPIIEVVAPVVQKAVEAESAVAQTPSKPELVLLVPQETALSASAPPKAGQTDTVKSKAAQTDPVHSELTFQNETSDKAPETLPLPASATPKSPLPAGGISRRTVLIGGGSLVGLAALGGGFWLANSHRSLGTSAAPILGTTLYTYHGHSGPVWSVAWSSDSKRVASGSSDKTVQVWDASDGGHVFTYRGHSDVVSAVAWSPNGQRVASASHDGTVQVWDASNGGNVFTYRGHSPDWVADVVWSPNGQRIASAGGDVQVWNANNGGDVFTYHNQGDFVAWSSDGTYIASTGRDGDVQVWNASNGTLVYSHNHFAGVYSLTWSPKESRVASGTGDGIVQIWDANGDHFFNYYGHSRAVDDPVEALAWSPDGNYIVCGNYGSTVQVWKAS